MYQMIYLFLLIVLTNFSKIKYFSESLLISLCNFFDLEKHLLNIRRGFPLTFTKFLFLIRFDPPRIEAIPKWYISSMGRNKTINFNSK